MLRNCLRSSELVALPMAALLVAGCISGERKIKATANGVLAGVAGVHGHFASEAAEICREMPRAETAVVPPMDKNCARGCRCASGKGDGEDRGRTYDCSAWSDPQWRMINFAGMYTLDETVSETVYVHHQARWYRTNQGCRLEFTLWGDLDADGVYSTYESWVEAKPSGSLGELPEASLLWE